MEYRKNVNYKYCIRMKAQVLDVSVTHFTSYLAVRMKHMTYSFESQLNARNKISQRVRAQTEPVDLTILNSAVHTWALVPTRCFSNIHIIDIVCELTSKKCQYKHWYFPTDTRTHEIHIQSLMLNNDIPSISWFPKHAFNIQFLFKMIIVVWCQCALLF